MPSVYAQIVDVAPRIGKRPLNETSSPSSVQVEKWLVEAEAELLGTLEAAGIGTSYVADSRGFVLIRGWVSNYIAGRVRQSHAAAGGDGTNDDGSAQVAEWRALLKLIRDDADGVGVMLSGGSTPAATVGLASHVTDPVLGLTESDYSPTFRIKGNDF